MIYLGSDHAGYRLKREIIAYLETVGASYKDYGCTDGEPVDYPNAAEETCNALLEAKADGDFAILVCGTGIGISIAANKINGIRAAVVTDAFTAEMAKLHNNANCICIGERVTGVGVALTAVKKYMETDFEGGRHARRVDKIMALEK
ncbi:MAG: ribose 5-phosphate isomerase B [Ruminococcus sp.]|jgi:ribose 5-phosphate isomerase B|nr:ribose 5-phosphate isomerase B [Ruminococcus sp.]